MNIDFDYEKKQLEKTIECAEKDALYSPNEKLCISKHGKYYQFYTKNTGSNSEKRIYLPKDKMPHVKNLIQRDYAKKVLAESRKQLSLLKNISGKLNLFPEKDIYSSTSEFRQAFIRKYSMTNEEYAELWQQEDYVRNPKTFTKTTYRTMNKEYVKSKSEIIIADNLFVANIPYRYEQQLYLKSFGFVYPDFTALNRRTRQIILIEHLGMIDNPEYATTAIKKINTYSRNGYLQGKNIIYTFETREDPLDPETIVQIIDEYLK